MASYKTLREKWEKRRRQRKRQLTLFRKTHKRGHQRAAGAAGRAMRKLVKLIAKNEPLRLKAYKHAVALVGVMERGGNNTGPVVDKIIKANGGVIGEPWCGDTMAFVYRLAGSKAVTRAWAAVALMLVVGVRRTSKPLRGDIVRYRFDHTGMFVRWLKPGDEGYTRPGDFEAIEGNTGATGAVSDSATGGDGVYRKVRNRDLVSDFLRVFR
jgi:hypothetical protein